MLTEGEAAEIQRLWAVINGVLRELASHTGACSERYDNIKRALFQIQARNDQTDREKGGWWRKNIIQIGFLALGVVGGLVALDRRITNAEDSITNVLDSNRGVFAQVQNQINAGVQVSMQKTIDTLTQRTNDALTKNNEDLKKSLADSADDVQNALDKRVKGDNARWKAIFDQIGSLNAAVKKMNPKYSPMPVPGDLTQ